MYLCVHLTVMLHTRQCLVLDWSFTAYKTWLAMSSKSGLKSESLPRVYQIISHYLPTYCPSDYLLADYTHCLKHQVDRMMDMLMLKASCSTYSLFSFIKWESSEVQAKSWALTLEHLPFSYLAAENSPQDPPQISICK